MNANVEKNEQAAQIIAKQLEKIYANQLMEANSAGGQLGLTEREGKATSMAIYFVERLYGFKFAGSLPENYTQDEKDAHEIVQNIVAKSIEIIGK